VLSRRGSRLDRSRQRWLAAFAGALIFASGAQAVEYVRIPAGTFSSVLASDATPGPVAYRAFDMRTHPVTQGEFQAFVIANPQWRRDRISRTFADAGYLQNWRSALVLASDQADRQPVVSVSWFAAQAFCEGEGARLPTWSEWELAAAADVSRRDAREDPAWRARILSWYARPATQALPSVAGSPNFYGVGDLHGLIWEWVDDFSALLVNPDSRSAEDGDKLQFCGAGAINLQQRENYAVLMRIALLSSLNASDSTSTLGFRCVRPIH